MKMEGILEDLEAAANKLGVKVTYETLAETVGGGGLCKVKGVYRVIVERRSTVGEKVSMLARALAVVGTDAVELQPETQAIVDRYRTERTS